MVETRRVAWRGRGDVAPSLGRARIGPAWWGRLGHGVGDCPDRDG